MLEATRIVLVDFELARLIADGDSAGLVSGVAGALVVQKLPGFFRGRLHNGHREKHKKQRESRRELQVSRAGQSRRKSARQKEKKKMRFTAFVCLQIKAATVQLIGAALT